MQKREANKLSKDASVVEGLRDGLVCFNLPQVDHFHQNRFNTSDVEQFSKTLAEWFPIEHLCL